MAIAGQAERDLQRKAMIQVDHDWTLQNGEEIMSKRKYAVALLMLGAMSLGAPAIAAPLTPLSVAAKPTADQSNVVQARWGWGGWHGGGFGWGLGAAFAGAA